MYWKKLKLIGHWQVVEFDLLSILTKVAETTEVISGTESGECQKIADQVRLIKIPVLQ